MPQVHLLDGRTVDIPEGLPPERVKILVNSYKANPSSVMRSEFDKQLSGMSPPETGPQVPTGDPSIPAMPVPVDGPLMATGALPPGHDYSQTDEWGPWANKMIASGARGTALGLATGADYVMNTGPEALYRLYQEQTGVDPKDYVKLGDEPIKGFVERNIIPQPQGSQYEDVESKAEVAGPLVLTAGRSALKEGIKTGAGLAAPLVRTGRDIGLGYAGGEAGGFIGEQIDKASGGTGETGRTVGTMFGGIAAPVAVPEGGRYLLRKMFTDETSAPMLQTIEDYNKFLPDYAPQIPPTIGLVGTKNAGLLEDILGRGVVSGGPSVRARRQQYEGLEAGVQDAVARTRGTHTTPIPATEKITAETIGNKASDMAVKVEAEANRKIDLIQNRLRNRIGADSPVDPSAIERELGDIINNPTKGTKSQERAKVLLNEFRRDYPPTRNAAGQPLPTVANPYFGKVQATRSEIGSTIDPATNKPITGAEKKLAVKGASEAMKETAVKQGVSPYEYDQAQSQTEQFARDREAAQKISRGAADGKRPKREKEAFNEIFGGAKKGGVEHLDSFERHDPDRMAEVLADKLELELRGETNAGLPVPVPETFPLQNLEQNWSKRSNEYKDVFSQNNPLVRGQLDRAAKIAEKEQVRPGRRTVPGKTGSTIGASQQILNPSILGGVTGGKLGALVAPLLSASGANLLGKALTNPKYVTGLIKGRHPVDVLATMLSRAVAGALPAAAIVNRDRAASERAAEEERKYREYDASTKRKREPGIQPHQPTDIGTIRPKGK